ncbi:hypothetical protein A0J59_08325 [Cellulosimicrobium sp. I38E]|nr:hypothetical protein A0J59_08325 [Cellulosimicrobium sp. I38E]
MAYRDSVINGTSATISATCEASTSKTYTHSVSASVEAKVKAGILGEMGVTAGYGFSASLSSGYSTSATFSVPARKTVKCDRGVYTEKMSGKTVYSYSGGGSGTIKTVSWSSTAPQRAAWSIY